MCNNCTSTAFAVTGTLYDYFYDIYFREFQQFSTSRCNRPVDPNFFGIINAYDIFIIINAYNIFLQPFTTNVILYDTILCTCVLCVSMYPISTINKINALRWIVASFLITSVGPLHSAYPTDKNFGWTGPNIEYL